jgi:hypothetical protein
MTIKNEMKPKKKEKEKEYGEDNQPVKKSKLQTKRYMELVADMIKLEKKVDKQDKCIAEKDKRIKVFENRWKKFINTLKGIGLVFLSLFILGGLCYVSYIYNDLMESIATAFGIWFIVFLLTTFFILFIDYLPTRKLKYDKEDYMFLIIISILIASIVTVCIYLFLTDLPDTIISRP